MTHAMHHFDLVGKAGRFIWQGEMIDLAEWAEDEAGCYSLPSQDDRLQISFEVRSQPDNAKLIVISEINGRPIKVGWPILENVNGEWTLPARVGWPITCVPTAILYLMIWTEIVTQ